MHSQCASIKGLFFFPRCSPYGFFRATNNRHYAHRRAYRPLANSMDHYKIYKKEEGWVRGGGDGTAANMNCTHNKSPGCNQIAFRCRSGKKRFEKYVKKFGFLFSLNQVGRANRFLLFHRFLGRIVKTLVALGHWALGLHCNSEG
jgi:hypothetical protein